VSGKRTALITGSIAAAVRRSRSSSPAEPRKVPYAAAEMRTAAPSTRLTEHDVPSGPPGDTESGPRLAPFPETRPATIDGWTVRDVYGGVALVGTDGVWTAQPVYHVPG